MHIDPITLNTKSDKLLYLLIEEQRKTNELLGQIASHQTADGTKNSQKGGNKIDNKTKR